MNIIDKETYKDFEIEASYNKKTKCFHAYSKVGNSHNKFDETLGNFCHGHRTPSEAVEDVKKKINKFLALSIKSYKELAEVLTENLTWTGHEECHLDEQVLKTALERFNLEKEGE